MLYGENYKNASQKSEPATEFVTHLHSQIKRLRLRDMGIDQFFLHSSTQTATNVFLRADGIKKPLQQPYQGPYEDVKRSFKFYNVNKDGREVGLSIYDSRPAHMWVATEEMDKNRLPVVEKQVKSEPSIPRTKLQNPINKFVLQHPNNINKTVSLSPKTTKNEDVL